MSQLNPSRSSFPSEEIDLAAERVSGGSGMFPHPGQDRRNLPGVPNTGNLLPVPQPPSLVTALQATLDPDRPVRKPVVIPGSRKRVPAVSAAAAVPGKKLLSPRLQLGFLMTAATLFLSLSLFSVAPIGQGQSGAMALKQAISLFASRTSNGLAAINMQQALDVPTAAPTQETQTETSGVVASGDYHAIARQAAVDHGISPDYFERQIQQESGFNPYAVSPAGALGIAQFIPSTAAGLGIDPLDPVQALNGAATLMADLASQFGGNYAMALAGYNAGPVATQNAINSCGDAWLSCLSAETQNYIAIIMG